MSEVEISSELLEALDRLSEPDTKSADAEQCQSNLDDIRGDAELVKRCVAGEVAAWEELYDQCHEPLLRTIRHLLGFERVDPNVADELAARVWYALVADDGKLLGRFDTRREARLGTFLRCIARYVAATYFRTERRRRISELVAGKRRSAKHGATGDTGSMMADLVEILTPSEQEFLDHCLMGDNTADVSPREYSSAYAWKLAARIRQKIKAFFRAESQDR